jgi:hypothetical protein
MATGTVYRKLFKGQQPERVRSALRQLDGGQLLTSLGAQLELALRGSDEATQEYVVGYRRLTVCLLAEARSGRPDLVTLREDGEIALIDAKGQPARAPIGALENALVEAPFSPWATAYDLGDAVALDLTSRVRVLLGHRGLTPPGTDEHFALTFDDLDAQRFIRRARHYLNNPHTEHPLRRIMGAFGLSKTELGGLFGVRRQAVDQWLARGVPPERQEKVAALDALADLLGRKLKADRLPGVARRPADAYDGETMLDLIRQDRHRELLDLVRRSFDWATAA